MTLSATATASAPATVASVQYLLDGEPLGPPVTTAPYAASWTVGNTPIGRHTLSAQVTDSNGSVGTAPVEKVHVVRDSSGGLSIDTSTTQNGRGAVSIKAFSTTVAGDTLVAFAALDGPSNGTQTTKVSGAGLTWHLVTRADAQLGDAEVWTATASGVLNNVRVTSRPEVSGYAQQLTVLAFSGAAGTGAAASASGPTGAPSVTITTPGGRFRFLRGGSRLGQRHRPDARHRAVAHRPVGRLDRRRYLLGARVLGHQHRSRGTGDDRRHRPDNRPVEHGSRGGDTGPGLAARTVAGQPGTRPGGVRRHAGGGRGPRWGVGALGALPRRRPSGGGAGGQPSVRGALGHDGGEQRRPYPHGGGHRRRGSHGQGRRAAWWSRIRPRR